MADYPSIQDQIRYFVDKYRDEVLTAINSKEYDLALLQLEDLLMDVRDSYIDIRASTTKAHMLGLYSWLLVLQKTLSKEDKLGLDTLLEKIAVKVDIVEGAATPKKIED